MWHDDKRKRLVIGRAKWSFVDSQVSLLPVLVGGVGMWGKVETQSLGSNRKGVWQLMGIPHCFEALLRALSVSRRVYLCMVVFPPLLQMT